MSRGGRRPSARPSPSHLAERQQARAGRRRSAGPRGGGGTSPPERKTFGAAQRLLGGFSSPAISLAVTSRLRAGAEQPAGEPPVEARAPPGQVGARGRRRRRGAGPRRAGGSLPAKASKAASIPASCALARPGTGEATRTRTCSSNSGSAVPSLRAAPGGRPVARPARPAARRRDCRSRRREGRPASSRATARRLAAAGAAKQPPPQAPALPRRDRQQVDADVASSPPPGRGRRARARSRRAGRGRARPRAAARCSAWQAPARRGRPRSSGSPRIAPSLDGRAGRSSTPSVGGDRRAQRSASVRGQLDAVAELPGRVGVEPQAHRARGRVEQTAQRSARTAEPGGEANHGLGGRVEGVGGNREHRHAVIESAASDNEARRRAPHRRSSAEPRRG